MVHPDKCRHARAKDAFEVIGAAHKVLLDEEQRAKLAFLLDHAKGGWVGVVCVGGWVGVRRSGCVWLCGGGLVWRVGRMQSQRSVSCAAAGNGTQSAAGGTRCPFLLPPQHAPLPRGAEEVKKDWKKAAKGDAAVRLATLMNDEGKQGVEAAFEQVRRRLVGRGLGARVCGRACRAWAGGAGAAGARQPEAAGALQHNH